MINQLKCTSNNCKYNWDNTCSCSNVSIGKNGCCINRMLTKNTNVETNVETYVVKISSGTRKLSKRLPDGTLKYIKFISQKELDEYQTKYKLGEEVVSIETNIVIVVE